MNGVFRRLYLLRWRASALLCLPGLLLVAWYAFGAFARFDAARRADGEKIALDLELFHLELNDLLRRDAARIRMRPPPVEPRIPRFALEIRRPDLNAMMDSRDQRERPYVPITLLSGVRGKERLQGEARLLGERPWHVLYKQASLKIQMPKGDLVDGSRVLTLTNDPSPMVVGEQLIVDLLAEHGVLVPRSDFARVSINDTDLGVYRYEAQPDEGVLRLNRREPGSMYSGDLSSSAKSDALWKGAEAWKKVAWREEEQKADLGELEHLLRMVREASVAEFVEFAKNELDLERFAAFDAVDVAFGCDQHNYRENHKLYFDPYRGRFEPIAWGFRGFEHDPVFHRVENPLMRRLEQVPDYVIQRNRALYELLTGDGSGAAVRARGLEILRRIGPELVSDPYWDAYRLLPKVTDFHRTMVRPMDMARALLVFDSELVTYERRRDFLLDELRGSTLWVRTSAQPTTDATRPVRDTQLELIVDGRSGVSLQRLDVSWPASCAEPSFQLFRGDEALTEVVSGKSVDLATALPLLPAKRIEARDDPDPEHGPVESVTLPERYELRLRASCTPERVEVQGLNLATLARVRARTATAEVLARLPERGLDPSDVPSFAPGEVSAHPWRLPAHPVEHVVLGPGSVEVPATRVFAQHQHVSVRAGTRLRMGAGASLVFLGPVRFEGTEREPISLEPASDEPWGGLALQGPGTAGARLSHVTVSGGSAPAWRKASFPAMVTVHDSRDVAIESCRFARNHGSDDALHAAYVKGLRIEDSTIADSHADAIDLEFTDAVLRRVKVGHAGDDALDLMGSRVVLADAVLVDLRGNGVSAGEQSEVAVHDTLIADAAVGLLAKNDSHIAVDGSLIFRAKTGVRVYTRSVRFEGDSRVRADVLFVVGSELPVRRDDRGEQALDVGRVQVRLPRHDSLVHLREDVLALTDWAELSGWVAPELAALRRSP